MQGFGAQYGRWLQCAATILALGADFPTITKADYGRAVFTFNDPDHQWAAVARELELYDPDGTRCLVSARNLFAAADAIRKELDQLFGRGHFSRKPRP